MIKLLTTAAVLVALIASATAADRIPAKFIGDWCGSLDYDAGSRYKRSSCRKVGEAGIGSGFEIRANRIITDGGETSCKVLRVRHMGNGEYLVRARCTTEEDAPRNKNFLISIDCDELVLR